MYYIVMFIACKEMNFLLVINIMFQEKLSL